ncbi:MAG: 2-oxoacid:ferredoxin oxidoreductase subunit gamma [Planctomycetes bacterium]|nr:2-oxoacid:ferredoxin oxidoreductase subunit gamma [Planctomycetota bacterium]
MKEKVILVGYGGQGMMLFGRILARAAMLDGKYVTFFPSYGTEVRGGAACYHLIVSTNEIHSPVVEEADTLIAMNQPSYLKLKDYMKPNSLLLLNSSMVKVDDPPGVKVYRLPATEMANELGNVVASNMIMMGAYNYIKNIIPMELFLDCLEKVLRGKKAALYEINKLALERGENYIRNNSFIDASAP